MIETNSLHAMDDWIDSMLDDDEETIVPEYDDSNQTEFTTDIRGDWT